MRFLSPPPSFYGGQRRNHRLLQHFLAIPNHDTVVVLVNRLAQDVVGCVVWVGVSRVGRGHGQGIIDRFEIGDDGGIKGRHHKSNRWFLPAGEIPLTETITIVRNSSQIGILTSYILATTKYKTHRAVIGQHRQGIADNGGIGMRRVAK